jgi:hypothetical protein
MKLTVIFGRVRAELTAEHRGSQHMVDVIVNGAARPLTLIGRLIVDSDSVLENKQGRMRNGWHFAHTVAGRRFIALAYRPATGLPVSPTLLHAPAYAWWPQQETSATGLLPSAGPVSCRTACGLPLP